MENLEDLVKSLIKNEYFKKAILNGVFSRAIHYDVAGWKDEITQAIMRAKEEKQDNLLKDMSKWLDDHLNPQIKSWKKKAQGETDRFIKEHIHGVIDRAVKREVERVVAEEIRGSLVSSASVFEQALRDRAKEWVGDHLEALRVSELLDFIETRGMFRDIVSSVLLTVFRKINRSKSDFTYQRLKNMADCYRKTA